MSGWPSQPDGSGRKDGSAEGASSARCGTAVGAAAEVKSRLQIADVVGETVQLRKAGTTLKGLCPFHSEKTPSFVVTPGRETWKCFGCGLGGDVFSFVMQRDGVAFPEALKVLAARAGVELDERTTRDDARRARLRDVLETAIAFYHQVLMRSKTGAPALEYLRSRGLTDETIERFQLGWAPGGWDTTSRQLESRRQVRSQELAEVGLTTQRSGGRGAYDRFRERIIFPIRDQNGNAVGLGGRTLPTPAADGAGNGNGNGNGAVPLPDASDHGPKYLNSPATPLFDKSRTLYLIDRAKGPMRKGGQAVIVEGYTDALMAHQAGFDNVVASLGTALTPQQIGLLTRYAKRVALAYDVDPAGEKAGAFGVSALEGIVPLLAREDSGVELDQVRVVRLPDGKDPDEVIQSSPDLWREEVRTAQPIVDYLIDYHARSADLRTPAGKNRFVDAIAPVLRSLPPVMRDGYLQEVHKVSGVEERTLLEVLFRRQGPATSAGVPVMSGQGGGSGAASSDGRFTADAVISSPDALPVKEILRAVSPVEAELLQVLLLVPDQGPRVAIAMREAGLELPSTVARELYRAILAHRGLAGEAGVYAEPAPFERGRFLEALDPETRGLAIALYARGGPDPAQLPEDRIVYAIDKCLLTLEADQLEERIAYTQAEQGDAERSGDREAMARLLDQERQYHEARRSLDRRAEQTRLLARTIGG
jgi:DNA primase